MSPCWSSPFLSSPSCLSATPPDHNPQMSALGTPMAPQEIPTDSSQSTPRVKRQTCKVTEEEPKQQAEVTETSPPPDPACNSASGT
ncbi:unnamed protein product [Arctogadus glacialis]